MTNEKLIVYTRYPEPGKTKTRMIPALGKEGAAKLQREMTEHTLNTARQLKESRNLEIEVHFTGGNKQLMLDWLGKDINYIIQVTGDLGAKMQSSFQQAFASNNQRVVTIGIDCPDISLDILNNAFDSLYKQELVLGVAKDGGYYLIGLNKMIPQLFQNINWGTEIVLKQTKAIAEQLNLNIKYLSSLSDVDYPEDLPVWQKYT